MLAGAGAGQSVKSVLPYAAVAWEFPISGSKGRAEYRDYAHTLGRLLNMSDVADRVKKIVIEHLGVDEGKISENASFIDDLGADSLDTVELVMAFEEEFGCEIPDDAAEKILTIKDAISFIESADG